jgi:hypothetical protein
MHNFTLNIKVDSNWVILSQRSFDSSSTITFQICGNEAEKDTPDSTILVIWTYGASELKKVLEYSKAALRNPREGQVNTNYEGWDVRTYLEPVGETKYKTAFALTTNKATGLGILIRLTWPLLKDNPRNYDQTMELLLESTMSQINQSHPEPQTK